MKKAAVLCAACMTVVILTGCGGKKTEPQSFSEETTTTTMTPTQKSETKETTKLNFTVKLGKTLSVDDAISVLADNYNHAYSFGKPLKSYRLTANNETVDVNGVACYQVSVLEGEETPAVGIAWIAVDGTSAYSFDEATKKFVKLEEAK